MVFNIADLLESVVDAVPEDRLAVVAGDRRLTYRDFDARANRFAHFLLSQGVGPGDHVGLHLFNGSEFLEAMYGCFKVRAVPLNINYRYVAEELRYLFKDADVKAIVHQAEFT
ncbi:MAG: AMP-binding protein, partial [Candidatus Methylomirabilis sp.]|nr:AMP-binding protein [Deltaproteobacteria bacterium]